MREMVADGQEEDGRAHWTSTALEVAPVVVAPVKAESLRTDVFWTVFDWAIRGGERGGNKKRIGTQSTSAQRGTDIWQVDSVT